jgi:hypothetical protein
MLVQCVEYVETPDHSATSEAMITSYGVAKKLMPTYASVKPSFIRANFSYGGGLE